MNGSCPLPGGAGSPEGKIGEGEGNVGQCCSMVSHAVVTLSAPPGAREAGRKRDWAGRRSCHLLIEGVHP